MDGQAFLASFAQKDGAEDDSSTNGKGDQTKALIQFQASKPSFAVPQKAKDIQLAPFQKDDKQTGSSHVYLKNIVNCSWPSLKRRAGQLVAAHRDGAYLAYCLTTPETRDGLVRVWHRKSEERALLKGMRGGVKDLAFSHEKDRVMLGCVDEFGSLFVFEIVMDGRGKVKGNLLLQVKGETPVSEDDYHRIVWCPYIPEEGEENASSSSSSPSSLLVLTNNNSAELWNVNFVVDKLGPGPHDGKQARQAIPAGGGGRLCIVDHKAAITSAAFSPDGTAVATASLDGQVKFFQVYMASPEAPRCLHEWSPHGGNPVTSLFFLDNHLDHSQGENFWKYVVTASDNDSEVKIWSCETWICLQTVGFAPSPGRKTPCFKACLDLRSRFLILSDIQNHSIYVLQLSESSSVGPMRVVSVSEFATPCAILSMAVMNCGVRKVNDDNKTSSDVEGDDDDDDFEIMTDEDDFGDNPVSSRKQLNKEATVIDLYIVQPKSFQSCRISYQDAWQKLGPANGLTQDPAVVIKVEPEDNVVDISDNDHEVEEIEQAMQKVQIKPEPQDEEEDVKPNLEQLLRGVAAASSSSANSSMAEAKDKITLLSPDAFDEKKTNTSEKRKRAHPEPEESSSSSEEEDPIVIKDEITLEDSEGPKPVTKAAMAVRSGNSSPSREVQDILGDSEKQGGLAGNAKNFQEADDEDDDDDDSLSDEESFIDSQEVLSDDEEEDEEEEEAVPVVVAAKEKKEQPAAASAAPWPSSVPPVPKPVAASPPSTSGNNKKEEAQVNASSSSPSDTAALMRKLTELTQLMNSQRSQMQSLRDDMKNVKQMAKNSEQKMAETAKGKDKLQDFIKRELDLRNHVLQQSLSSSLQKSLEKTVREEVTKAVSSDKKNQAQQQQHMQQQLQQQQQQSKQVMQTLCSASEKHVVEHMRAFVASKAFNEQVMRPMADKVAMMAQGVIKEQMIQILAPSIEKAVREMLHQVQGSLQRGVTDTSQVSRQLAESVLGEVRAQAAKEGPQLQTLRTELQQGLAGVARAIEAQAASNGAAGNGFGGPDLDTSIAASPVSRNLIKETQEKIKQLLASGQQNDAFQTALSASNLQLVLQTCEMVNPATLFGSRCVLTQTVLLSLLQQISHNLEERTDLKLKYLEEGVMCLDVEDKIVQKHVGSILTVVQEGVTGLIRSQGDEIDPGRKRQLRLFLMAMQAVVKTATGQH